MFSFTNAGIKIMHDVSEAACIYLLQVEDKYAYPLLPMKYSIFAFILATTIK
jgi:hypothetical protein